MLQRSATGPRGGFTLIELLVVVTIIVVLLAVLVPAMSRAIYEAELTICGTNLRAVATGANAYAFDFNRSYPYRAGVVQFGYRATKLHRPNEGIAGDLRPVIRSYIAVNKLLNDPLAEAVDLEVMDSRAWVYSNVALWFGWRWTSPQGQGNMQRVGGRFGFAGGLFDLLASDDHVSNQQTTIYGPHPDALGVLYNQAWQQEGASPTGETNVISRWISEVTVARGKVDQNYAHDDASVTRLPQILYNHDDRMAWVPLWPGSGNNVGDWVTYLPRR